MSLSPENESGDSFNFCLQKSIARWEPRFKDLFSKRRQICRKLQIWSNLLKKSLMENFIFCAMDFDLSLLWPSLEVVLSHFAIS